MYICIYMYMYIVHCIFVHVHVQYVVMVSGIDVLIGEFFFYTIQF